MWQRFRHHPLIGTTVEIRVFGADPATASRLDELVVTEMARLESIFNSFDPASELSRWKRDEIDEPSPEFCDLMSRALHWHERSDGRFNPMAGALSVVWRDAETADRVPSRERLAEVAASIRAPRFRISEGVPVRVGDCDYLDVNAIAKGFIVDRALDAISQAGVGLVVNAGGDLAHRGAGSVDVGVENPFRPYDNEPALTTVTLDQTAIATSGGARRGFRVDGRWFSHVIDPRSGWPVDHSASITVSAPDAMTADVAATVLGVPEPDEAATEAADLGVSCLCVLRDGDVVTSPNWPEPARVNRG